MRRVWASYRSKLPAMALGRSIVLLSLALFGSIARAAPCAGFIDVDDTSPYCASVAWLKSRGITFGCQPNLFCPAKPVSRVEMAAFISRLAPLLPPVVVDSKGKVVGGLIDPWVRYRGESGTFLLIIAPTSSPEHYDFIPDSLFFSTPDCTGTPYMSPHPFYLGGPVEYAQKAAVIVGLTGDRLLYVNADYPVQVPWIEVRSRRGAACTSLDPRFVRGMEIVFVENLSSRFSSPFQIVF